MSLLKKVKKKLVLKKDYKNVTKNIVALSMLQIVNYIFPLLTLPYLLRVLGPENYGLVAFAQSLIMFLVLFSDYGFNLTATRQIAIHKDDPIAVNKIVSTVFTIKAFLVILSFGLMTALAFVFPQVKDNYLLFVFTFGMLIGQTFFPMFFFQGIEQMKYITMLNVIMRTIFTLSIFIFIKTKSDYILVPIVNSAGFLLVAAISFYLLIFKFKVRFVRPTISDMKEQLIEGWPLFLSSFASSIYTVTTPFILGLFASHTVVGYYSSAEKLITSIKGLITPISQAFYPFISKKMNQNKEDTVALVKKLCIGIGIFFLGVSLFLFVFAGPIVHIIFGPKYEESVIVLRIMAFIPFFVAIGNVASVQLLIPSGYSKWVAKSVVLGAMLNFILVAIFVPTLQHIGTAITVLATEMSVTILYFVYIKKENLMRFRSVKGKEN